VVRIDRKSSSFSAAAVSEFPPPTSNTAPDSVSNVLNLSGTETDTQTIKDTALVVDQKGWATDDEPPNQPVPETTVTAVDGQLVDNIALSSVQSRRSTSLNRRANSGYDQVFAGSVSGPDGSIQGTAYLTYTVLPNATYDIDGCLSFCDSVRLCGSLSHHFIFDMLFFLLMDTVVFANLYYEFNNHLLDSNNQESNLKCALYADIHSAAEKTNLGGQQLLPPPAGLTYITNSTGWAAKSLTEPAVPEGYELVFGPVNGANNAPGVSQCSILDY